MAVSCASLLCLKCLSEAVPVQPDIDSSSSVLRETSEAMC